MSDAAALLMTYGWFAALVYLPWPWWLVAIICIPLVIIFSGAITGVYKGLRDAYDYRSRKGEL